MRCVVWLGLTCVMVCLPVACGGGDEFKLSGTGGATGGMAGTGTGGNPAGGTSGGGTGGSGAAGGVAGAGGSMGGAAGAGGTGGLAGAGGGTGASGGSGGADGGGGTGGFGPGTYVSEKIGSDANPGTAAAPVKTIGEGINKATQLGGNATVYVAEGTYSEKVKLTQGISLLGGHQCDSTSCTWARDPTKFVTTIQNTDAEGVLADAKITVTTKIDGFTIEGLAGPATGNGRAALTLQGGTPTVSGNVILAPDVTSGGSWTATRSLGIVISSPSNPTSSALIDGNVIKGGSSPEVTAAIAFDSGGSGKSFAIVTNNVISGGHGKFARGIVAWSTGQGTRVAKNQITAGTSVNSSGDAWAIVVGGELEIDANQIHADLTKVGSCTGSAHCGGILSVSSKSTITNNLVFGMNASWSVAVELAELEVPAGEVVLNANTLHGAGLPNGTSAALVVRIGSCGNCGLNGFVGKIRNNILIGGGGASAFGVYEDAPAGKTQHPAVLEHNDFWLSSSSSSSALYRAYDGTTQTLLNTIAEVNMTNVQTTVGNNINQSPKLDNTWHLSNNSPCINAGTTSEAPSKDIDGDPRPKPNTAVDIGADEAG